MNRARNKIILLLTFLIVFATFIICINVNGDVGDFTGYIEYSSDTLLYNATNTYNYAGPNTEHSSTFDYFDLTQPNLNQVSNDAQITVLTHGLGGGASHWSNDGSGSFAYDSESLISRLDDLNYQINGTRANIYLAEMTGHDSFILYLLNNYNYASRECVSNIYGVNKHIIIQTFFKETRAIIASFSTCSYKLYEQVIKK